MGRRPFVKDRILEAAFDLVAKRGYEAVSTRDIAAAANVGHASMYRHFPSKEALGRELYAKAMPPLEEAVGPASDAQSAKTFLRTVVAALYQAYDERPRALALLLFPPHEFTPWELDPANPTAIRSQLDTAIGDPDLAALVWGAISGPLIDRYLRRRTSPMGTLAEAHAKLVVRLLRGGSA